VRGVELVRRRASATRGVVDLGEVPAPDDARHLVGLAQSDDPRVPALIESILLGK